MYLCVCILEQRISDGEGMYIYIYILNEKFEIQVFGYFFWILLVLYKF